MTAPDPTDDLARKIRDVLRDHDVEAYLHGTPETQAAVDKILRDIQRVLRWRGL